MRRLLVPLALLPGLAGAASAGDDPLWQLAPGQTNGGVVLSTPGIAPMESAEQAASIFVGLPADLLGDARPELLFCHGTIPPNPPQAQPCRVLETLPDGSVIDRSFQLFGASLPMTTASRDIEVADFNGDGRDDIYISSQGYDALPFPGERNVLLVSRPDGTYENRSAALPSAPDFTHSTSSGDIDDDGDLDLIVGNFGNAQTNFVYLLINDGAANFSVDTSALPAPVVNLTEAYTTFQFGDFNHDGFADLFLGASAGATPTSYVLLNDGAGQFDTLPRVALPAGPLGAGNEIVLDALVLDLDADGALDLLVLASSSSYTGMTLQALVNNGDGTFRDETLLRFGAEARRMTGGPFSRFRTGDFNLDGATDFHFGDGPDEDPRYWINDGAGAFAALTTAFLGRTCTFGVHTLDFDADGRPDQLQLEHYPGGDLLYASFFNRTAVPSVFADGFETLAD